MKTLTLTYHWMPNYGAVLQTYALQKFLLEHDIENKVIDYVPSQIKWRSYLGYVMRRKIEILRRIAYTRDFIKNEVALTDKKYVNHKQLLGLSEEYDAVICGSDQIWCEWFIKNAEIEYTYSYYLDFVEEGKRIAYAASIGNSLFHIDEIKSEIGKNLNAFRAIGVRENVARNFVEEYGLKANVVCDPVFLIDRKVYEDLTSKSDIKISDAYMYILHNNTSLPKQIVKSILKDDNLSLKIKTVYDWLSRIKNSRLVITDSFHCVAFSIIFHIPFIVIPTSEKGFDDRIETILGKLCLMGRMCNGGNEVLKKLQNINWNEVDMLLKQYVDESKNYLLASLDKRGEYNELSD